MNASILLGYVPDLVKMATADTFTKFQVANGDPSMEPPAIANICSR